MLQNIFLIAGLYILCSGLISWYQNFVFFNKCKKTKGKIISHYYQIDSNKNDQIRKPYPIFQYYHPVSEKEHTLRSNVSELMKEGQEIDIYYDPRDPNQARIGDLIHTWLIPISVTFLGVFFSYIGILIRNLESNLYGFYDKILLFVLSIIFILNLLKSLQLLIDDPYKSRKF